MRRIKNAMWTAYRVLLVLVEVGGDALDAVRGLRHERWPGRPGPGP